MLASTDRRPSRRSHHRPPRCCDPPFGLPIATLLIECCDDRWNPPYAHLPLAWIVENLNPVLRGWGAYFRYGNSARKFAAIDAYVNQRLAMLASTKHGLRGWNWTTRFTHEWTSSLGVHRLNGTVRPTTAYASR